MSQGAAPAAGRVLGYCANVHPGTTVAQIVANLRLHAGAVRAALDPAAPLPVGLFIPAAAAAELAVAAARRAFADELRAIGVRPFTVNGFPFGDFHQEEVRHLVYRPDWSQPARAEYTMALADLLADLLEPAQEGSISTLPVGWPADRPDAAAAAANLARVIGHLADLEERRGVCLHLDLEPEPGCVIETGSSLIGWIGRHLAPRVRPHTLRRHLRACHDICHAAVMFEDQAALLAGYRDAGILVGKVQISSGLRARLAGRPAAERRQILEQLASLRERRYLHQTAVESGGGVRLFEDLAPALADSGGAQGDEWRVHFHVPVHLERIGRLDTTQGSILECLDLLRGDAIRHFEVETYAWGVLPQRYRLPTLAQEIARELAWVRARAPAGFFA
jgi:hypothetical protein